MTYIDTLYVDLDGVLVNFEKGIADTIKEYVGDKRNKLDDAVLQILDEMQRQIESGADVGDMLSRREYKEAIRLIIGMEPEWWTDLEWMPDGKELWNAIKKYNPVILSSPLNKTQWEKKRSWVARELGSHVKVLIEDDKEVHAAPTALLIDDRPHHSDFEAHGGHIIKHTNTPDTLSQIKSFDLSGTQVSEKRILNFTRFINEKLGK